MNEREKLVARAKELELSHAANISDDKLKVKIAEAEAKAKAKADADAKAKADAEAKAKADAAAKVKAAASAEAKTKAKANLVVVKGPERGRWRIGKHFTREAEEIPRDELTDDELEALENDPELIVSFR